MSPLRSRTWVLATFVLAVLATPASGNEIKLHFESYIPSLTPEYPPPDGYNVYMATYPGSSQLQTLVGGAIGGFYGFQGTFPVFTVPTGSRILSAIMTISYATERQRSYEPPVFEVLPPPDPDQRSVTGRILATVFTHNTVPEIHVGGDCESLGVTDFQSMDLMKQGCDPLRNGTLEITMLESVQQEIVPTALDPGFNSAETFYVEDDNHTPISGELDITLTPEPSPLILIGTGMMMLLAGIAFRRRARATAGFMQMTH